MEETAWRPGQSVAEDVQFRQVDPDPLVADGADSVTDDDACLVDGEHVPHGARAKPGIGERPEPGDRDGLGVGESRRIHHRPDDGGDAVGLEC